MIRKINVKDTDIYNGRFIFNNQYNNGEIIIRDKKNIVKELIIEGKPMQLYYFSGTNIEKVIFHNRCNILPGCFQNKEYLKEVKFLSKNNYVYGNSFANCNSLEKLIIDSTSTFTYDGFNGCPNIRKVYINNRNINIDKSKYSFIQFDRVYDFDNKEYVSSILFGNLDERIKISVGSDKNKYLYDCLEEYKNGTNINISDIYKNIDFYSSSNSVNDKIDINIRNNCKSITFDNLINNLIYFNNMSNSLEQFIIPYTRNNVNFKIYLPSDNKIKNIIIKKDEINSLDNEDNYININFTDNTVKKIYNKNEYYLIETNNETFVITPEYNMISFDKNLAPKQIYDNIAIFNINNKIYELLSKEVSKELLCKIKELLEQSEKNMHIKKYK